MNINLQFGIYISILLFAFLASIRHFRKLTRGLKFIAVLLGYTIVTECIAAYMAYKYHQNLIVYHVYVPVSLGFIAFYYHYSFAELKKKGIGYIITVAGIIVALVNSLYLQPVPDFDSNATLFAGLCIIVLSLYCFYRIYADDSNMHFSRSAQFWLALLFLFYYCTTFLLFGFMQYFGAEKAFGILDGLYMTLWAINLIFYFGTGLVFLLVVPHKRYYGT